jgi:hypothetical protein
VRGKASFERRSHAQRLTRPKLYHMKWSATAAAWFSTFLPKAFVRRV